MPEVTVKGQVDENGRPLRQFVTQQELQANPDRYELAGESALANFGGVEGSISQKDLAASAVDLQTSEDLANRARERGQEAQHSGITAAGTAFAEGLGDAATLGLGTAARIAAAEAEGDFGASDRIRGRAKQQRAARLAGELAGDIALTALSGGAGRLAKLAAATPGGALARGAQKIAKGKATDTATTQLARTALAGATDAGIASVGNAIARAALEDAPLSGEALIASGLTGAGLGTLFGGVSVGLGKGLQAAGRRMRSGAATAEDFATADAVAVTAAAKGRRAPATPRKLVPLERRTRDAVREEATRLTRSLDNHSVLSRELGREARELSPLVGADLAGDIRIAQQAYRDAVTAARGRFRKLTRSVADGATGDLVDDAGTAIATLQRVETTAVSLDTALTKARTATGRPPRELTPFAPDDGFPAWLEKTRRTAQRQQAAEAVALPDPTAAAPGLTQRVRGLGQRAGDILGVAEVAQELGLPVPDVGEIPGVGPLVELYARYRAGRMALGRIGSFAGSSTTRAAERVVGIRDRSTRIVADALQTTGRALQVPAVPIVSARALGRVASEIRDVRERAQDPEGIASDVAHALAGAPDPLIDAAVSVEQRKAAVLAREAPTVPFVGTPFADLDAELPERELRLWKHKVWAADNPLDVTQRAAQGIPDPDAWRIVQAIYPRLMEDVRSRVFAQQAAIVDAMPRPRRQVFGSFSGVALHESQLDTYQSLVAQTSAAKQAREQEQAPPGQRRGAPSNAAASPMVQNEQPRGQGF